MNGTFTNESDFGKISLNDITKEKNNMILYAFLSENHAKKLFKYYLGLRLDARKIYKTANPLQIPITLYESPKMAKLMSVQSNEQLVAFSINNHNFKVYDEFNIFLKEDIKNSGMQIEEYKKNSVLWREKRKYNNLEYIEYTIRSKDIVTEIQLQDF